MTWYRKTEAFAFGVLTTGLIIKDPYFTSIGLVLAFVAFMVGAYKEQE